MAGKVNQMRSVQYSGYGGGPASLKHVNIPIPIPKKGEFLVKIQAASVNPVDWKINKGQLRPVLPSKFPHCPGTDIAGEVFRIGAGTGVTDYEVGDRVACWIDIRTGGSLAEYAIASPKTSARLPSNVSVRDGACLPVAGMSALQSLANAGVKVGGNYSGNVLITAAAGGVGLYAVQLAKLGGAHVTATVGERNIELVKGLGADEVLNYKTEDGMKLASPSGKKYDVVLNCANLKWSTIQPQLSPMGEVLELDPSFGTLGSSLVKRITMSKQKRSLFFMSANAKDLTFLVGLIAEGKLKTFVDSEYPLRKAEDAWTKSKDGHSTGKILVTMVDK